jgi:hypothetical protein
VVQFLDAESVGNGDASLAVIRLAFYAGSRRAGTDVVTAQAGRYYDRTIITIGMGPPLRYASAYPRRRC